MPLTGLQAWAVCELAKEVQKSSGCTIPADFCELGCDLRNGRLWIGLRASGLQLWGSPSIRRASLHITILTAERIASAPPADLLARLLHSLKGMVSREQFVVAGQPDYILHGPTDLPHRVVLTLHVQSRLHQRLSSARHTFLQAFKCPVVDYRTNFHLSVDDIQCVVGPAPIALAAFGQVPWD